MCTTARPQAARSTPAPPPRLGLHRDGLDAPGEWLSQIGPGFGPTTHHLRAWPKLPGWRACEGHARGMRGASNGRTSRLERRQTPEVPQAAGPEVRLGAPQY